MVEVASLGHLRIIKSKGFLNSTFVIRHSKKLLLIGDSGFFEGHHISKDADCTLHNTHGQRTAGSFPQSHPQIQDRV
jgi:hypothetical protein